MQVEDANSQQSIFLQMLGARTSNATACCSGLSGGLATIKYEFLSKEKRRPCSFTASDAAAHSDDRFGHPIASTLRGRRPLSNELLCKRKRASSGGSSEERVLPSASFSVALASVNGSIVVGIVGGLVHSRFIQHFFILASGINALALAQRPLCMQSRVQYIFRKPHTTQTSINRRVAVWVVGAVFPARS